MAEIGIHRTDMQAAHAMASGICPVCHDEAVACNVCGDTGRLLPYRVNEGVRCVTCQSFRRVNPPPWGPIRFCALTGSPLWSPWIWHACPSWGIGFGLWLGGSERGVGEGESCHPNR
ncbi:hypothetical protein [Solidesulfovibrio sp.]